MPANRVYMMDDKRTTRLDCEVYRNYFLALFQDHATGKLVAFEKYDGQDLDLVKLQRFLLSYRLITFNGINYDLPILAVALSGASCADIKRASDDIIQNGLKPWHIEKKYGVRVPKCDHIDLIEVAPGIASLKVYGGRLHAPKMQDLPIEHDAEITAEQRDLLRLYCGNDLATTGRLYDKLLPQIQLRERMSAEYGIDLRSKSDAQIAEAVIAHQIKRATGDDVVRDEVEPGTEYGYTVPEWINFQTPALRATLDMVHRAVFRVAAGGNVLEPPEFKGASVTIGQGVYRLGIGGLHSSEQCAAHVTDDEHIIVDRDVASYYPAIILGQGLEPEPMAGVFSGVYRNIVKRRLDAKRSGDKVTADALKITINGSFGKFGSKWSKLYAPRLLIQTTVTGQLALLMLIEDLEDYGIRVISANTDGIVIKCHVDDIATMDEAVRQWEARTGFETEQTHYRAIYSRDVNNYIAVKPDGGIKLKGVYAPASLAKNPVNEVCNRAAVAWLKDNVPVEQTIRSCADIRQFLTIRQVKGGAVDSAGNFLGRAARWYYGRGATGVIRYKVNGYTVARSEGAVPCMDLPEVFPDDVDHDWYIRETVEILRDVGAYSLIA